ncbi:Uncharacterized protein dnm_062240 [Desulfonema magnum]|uniref:Uncharacterized protein n=1 Tax=Desulfonema magnum TaxID=45655 RepID=A0A975GRM8_9BACT|nr:Uncharacterized protein dnm_062240 [Desulfonema magnum]
MGEAKRNPPYADVRWVPLRFTHPTFSTFFRTGYIIYLEFPKLVTGIKIPCLKIITKLSQ